VYRTGVGKSQLAIELASALSGKQGEVINADSMQVYRGLDIITNKATQAEMKGVPHHLMDFLEPGQEYRVDRFRTDAMQKVPPLLAINLDKADSSTPR
jgi:tRNA dimethylallyltransferase